MTARDEAPTPEDLLTRIIYRLERIPYADDNYVLYVGGEFGPTLGEMRSALASPRTDPDLADRLDGIADRPMHPVTSLLGSQRADLRAAARILRGDR